jgi:hypothetical protein
LNLTWNDFLDKENSNGKLGVETMEKNLGRLSQAIREGDVVTVYALLESGNVDVNGVGGEVRLLSVLR